MRIIKLASSLILALSLTGCIGAVIGVAVDTTVAVVKAPFQITGAVLGVAADTAGTVIATPFRIVDAAVGGVHDHHRDGHDHNRDRHNHRRDHGPGEHYVYTGDDDEEDSR